jgi:hypothetical protein
MSTWEYSIMSASRVSCGLLTPHSAAVAMSTAETIRSFESLLLMYT